MTRPSEDLVSLNEPDLVSATELHRLLTGADEVALLDVREEYEYGQAHILLSTLLPFSQIEMRVAALVPRRATRVILCGDVDESLVRRAVARLSRLGYGNVAVLSGGVAAWQASGRPLFTTTHVLAKTFGGTAERILQTPHLNAEALMAKMAAGDDVAIFDARTFKEFKAGSLPGALNCPLAELPYRVPASIRSDDTLIVINCASRTRGILGAQSLLNAGSRNPIAVLENGMMAWSLAGGHVVRGAEGVAPEPAGVVPGAPNGCAQGLARDLGVTLIGRSTLDTFRADAGRSLYVFDVRTPEAFQAGHWRHARSAPGGQLIMTILQYVATHRSRIVLLDGGDNVRAVTTASWLQQLGRHDVFVLGEPPTGKFTAGPEPIPAEAEACRATWMSPNEAHRMLETAEAIVLDVENSVGYREGHLPGATFAMRTRLPEGLDAAAGPVLVTSANGALAGLTAQDLEGQVSGPVYALRGGTDGWRAAGLLLETGPGAALHPFQDMWPSPMLAVDRQAALFQDYLRWEMSLADQVATDPTVAFRLDPAPARRQ